MLDLPPDELRRHLHAASDWVAHYLETLEERPVLPRVRPGDFAARLPARPPEEGEPMDRILEDFDRLVPDAITHWNHPSFHAWFSNTASGPGIIGELLAAALNNNAMVWRSGPASTELEAVTCDWLRQLLGLPEDFDGHINDTASVGTATALAAARQTATGGTVRREGLGACAPLRIYTSEEAHSSVERAAILLGLGQDGVVKLPTDEDFRLRVDALEEAVTADRAAGRVPMAVVATVGTTATTSVDPVPAVADVCAREGIWLHVDAAYGGAMAVVEEYRWVLAGCERADSLVVNPHKWLFVPMDCSVLWCRRPAALREAFSLVPSYLMTPEDGMARNLMDYGPALGRRFRSLKLWMVLRAYGRRGLAGGIRRHVELAAALQSWIAAEAEWEQMAPAPMSTVLFRHHPEGMDDEEELRRHNEAVLERVNADGRIFLSHTMVRGRFALRLAIGNARTEMRHIETAWRRLREAAAAV
jgi:aromatic-L-amino-acid decarboxylase